MHRICVYRVAAGPLTETGDTREYRVGLGDNCPAQPRDPLASPLPATARLQSEEITGQTRRCAYEQAGTAWQRTVPISQYCPLYAGMLPPEQPEPAVRR
ncbi:MAG: hypothetical protein AB7I42_30295 [Bradyrhizobium sp.]|uniref:hypothetical protein n=1 Tax=Bradyrhizobium sp. TaxID=376 RepID=UPI003D134737